MKSKKLIANLLTMGMILSSASGCIYGKEQQNLPKVDLEANISFQVLSDTHFGWDPNDATTQFMVNTIFEDIKQNDPDSAAILVTGDLTDGGSESAYANFFDTFGTYAPTPVFYAAMGNHDVRWNGGYNIVYDRYKRHHLDKIGVDKPYFMKEIEGYNFIVLNTEKDLKDEAYLSEDQLTWLETTLEELTLQDPTKPAFIFIHQAISNTIENSHIIQNTVGEQNFEMKQILAKYPQTVYFSGHLHNYTSLPAPVFDDKYCTFVDVPSAGYDKQGYYVEVFDDRIELKLRDFTNQTWLEARSYTIDIPANIPKVDLEKPYWEMGKGVAAKTDELGILKLEWEHATDNMGVVGYKVYEGERLVAELSDRTSIEISGLEAYKAYNFRVEAIDEEGNTSDKPLVSTFTPEKNSYDTKDLYAKIPEEITNEAMFYLDFENTYADRTLQIEPTLAKGNAKFQESPYGVAGKFDTSNILSLGDLKYGAEDFSISFLVKADSKGVRDIPFIANKPFAYRQNPGWIVAADKPDVLWWNMAQDREYSEVLGEAARPSYKGSTRNDNIVLVNDETWHHLVITNDRTNNTTKVYRDGVLEQTLDTTHLAGKSMDNGRKTYIGADGDLNTWTSFEFLMDEAMITKSVLSEQQINTLYTTYNDVKSELVGLYSEVRKMDESQYTQVSWNTFMDIVDGVKQALLSEDVNIIQEAIQDLKVGMGKLERSIEELDDRDGRVSYIGSGWTQGSSPNSYQGTETYSRTTGDKVEFEFEGEGIEYVASRQNNAGKVKIYIDNEFITEITPYQSASEKNIVLFSKLDLEPGSHKLTLEVAGGGSSSEFVMVDGFIVHSEVKPKAPIKEIPAPRDVTLTLGKKIVLPEKLSVIFEDNTFEVKKVTWDTEHLNWEQVGVYELTGTFEDYAETVSFTITIQEDSQEVQLQVIGADTVKSGETFKVAIGTKEPTENIYAGDFMVSYDPNVFELKEVEKIDPTIMPGQNQIDEETIRMITAFEKGITPSNWIAMEFLAKETEMDQMGSITVKEAQLARVIEGVETIFTPSMQGKEITVKGMPIVTTTPEDINQDNQVDIADLALVAYYYKQVEENNPNWDKAKKADVNKDGEVDIKDMTLVATKILGNK